MCAEGQELAQFGADCRGCMTTDVYEKAVGLSMDFPKKKPLRQECECFMGNDIGAYNTCMYLCKYCYANYDEEIVRRIMNVNAATSMNYTYSQTYTGSVK